MRLVFQCLPTSLDSNAQVHVGQEPNRLDKVIVPFFGIRKVFPENLDVGLGCGLKSFPS
jgi:hypothetical protein